MPEKPLLSAWLPRTTFSVLPPRRLIPFLRFSLVVFSDTSESARVLVFETIPAAAPPVSSFCVTSTW
jgi:hypothetical protein